MRNNRMNVAAASLILISAAGTAWADDAPAAPAKPALPSIADLLTGSGITATGEVSATYDHQGFSGSNAQFPQQDSYSTFTLQQAALMAYTDNFQLLAYLSLICIPPVVFLRKLKRRPLAGTGTAEK